MRSSKGVLVKYNRLYDTSGSHSSEYLDYSLLGSDTV